MVLRLNRFLSAEGFELGNHPPPTIPSVSSEDLKKMYDMKCAFCFYSNRNVFVMVNVKLEETTSKQEMLNMHLKLEKGELDDLLASITEGRSLQAQTGRRLLYMQLPSWSKEYKTVQTHHSDVLLSNTK
ncbi:unnamed protein product [Bursaphelenchus xylophilus]|uniref:(pine wood nematode) hypothetical protein n=1 Tax=Bursaphelenchus xylophilus TaxID=6326 RepID=A0A1I7SN52_BURXY|nr:unnamed protein product [Bursaphelenchus xylophilus]CAG9089665.1 unnamed protein product [Bursaphelenchus xylophilus]